MAMFLVRGSGLLKFCQSMCTFLPAGHCAPCLDRISQCRKKGLPHSLMGVFSPQFHLYLENQCSWTGSVCASLVCSYCTAGFPTTLHLESMSLSVFFRGKPQGCSTLLIVKPRRLKFYTICTVHCVLKLPRGKFSPEVIILGGL